MTCPRGSGGPTAELVLLLAEGEVHRVLHSPGRPRHEDRCAPFVYQNRADADQRVKGDTLRSSPMTDTSIDYQDSAVEVHRLVVGPVDNNVYIVRCRATGESAAHRRGQRARQAARAVPGPRRPPGGGDPRALGPHPGRGGGPRRRDRRGRHPGRRGDAALLRPDPGGPIGPRGRAVAHGDHRHARPHPGVDVLRRGGDPSAVQRGHALPRRARATPRSSTRTSPPSSSRSRGACSPPSAPRPWSCPDTARAPPSAPSHPTSRSGSIGAGDRWSIGRRAAAGSAQMAVEGRRGSRISSISGGRPLIDTPPGTSEPTSMVTREPASGMPSTFR